MSSPPKPARRVSFIRYSFRRTRRTFSTMIRLSFRLTFASAGISRHLFQDNLEVHGVLVPWTAPAVCSGHRLDLVFNRVPELRHPTPHLSGMNFDDRVAPTPGPLCVTGLRVIANSPT